MSMFKIIGDKALGMTPEQLVEECKNLLKDLTPEEFQDPNIIYLDKDETTINNETFTKED